MGKCWEPGHWREREGGGEGETKREGGGERSSNAGVSVELTICTTALLLYTIVHCCILLYLCLRDMTDARKKLVP